MGQLVPEIISKKEKKDNCRNLDKGRNSEEKFYPIERMLPVLYVCMYVCMYEIRSTSISTVQ
jgi:hypothetical protein